ncbi:hypothetical protein AB0E69_13560 [Kribbella sp. NPDC026611]|uniref:hypothetical protein n=1 Tax=Kribbella sp. NPDC026611 TaxID=3154911 RepID=UPI0033E8CF5B
MFDVPKIPQRGRSGPRPAKQTGAAARIAIWGSGFVVVLAFAVFVLNAGAGVLVGGTFITGVVILADRIGARVLALAGVVTPKAPEPDAVPDGTGAGRERESSAGLEPGAGRRPGPSPGYESGAVAEVLGGLRPQIAAAAQPGEQFDGSATEPPATTPEKV